MDFFNQFSTNHLEPAYLKSPNINSVFLQSSRDEHQSINKASPIPNLLKSTDVAEVNIHVPGLEVHVSTFIPEMILKDALDLSYLTEPEKRLWERLKINKTLIEFFMNSTEEEWTSNLNASSEVVPSINLSDEALILVPLYAAIFLLAMVGNSLVLVTLLQNKRMRTPTNVLLLNLAISDLLLGVVCMPFTLAGFLLRDFVFGAVLCRIIPYLQAVSVSVSAYTLVTISLERYFGICFPLKTRLWRSLSHSYKLISVVWVISFIFSAPIAITSTLQPISSGRHKCREEWPNALGVQIYTIFLDLTLLVFPLVLMMTVYFRICQALWIHIKNEQMPEEQHSNNSVQSRGEAVLLSVQPSTKKHPVKKIYSNPLRSPADEPNLTIPNEGTYRKHSLELQSSRRTENWVPGCSREGGISVRPRHSSPRKKELIERSILRKTNTKKSLQNKKRIIKMLFVVVLEFFICWTPLYVINTITAFAPSKVYETLGMGGVSAFHLLAFCSSCCNPITYCFMNASFRRAFLSAVGCKRETSTSQCDEVHNIFSHKQ